MERQTKSSFVVVYRNNGQRYKSLQMTKKKSTKLEKFEEFEEVCENNWNGSKSYH